MLFRSLLVITTLLNISCNSPETNNVTNKQLKAENSNDPAKIFLEIKKPESAFNEKISLKDFWGNYSNLISFSRYPNNNFLAKRLMIWEVTKKESLTKSFIIGTISADLNRFQHIPKRLGDIFLRSDNYLRMGINETFLKGYLVDGFDKTKNFNIKQHLSGSEWILLNLFMGRHNINENVLQYSKPAFLSFLFNYIPVGEESIADFFIHDYIEGTVGVNEFDSLEVLDNLNKINQDELIQMIKNKSTNLLGTIEQLKNNIRHYNENDLPFFDDLLYKEEKEYPEFYRITRKDPAKKMVNAILSNLDFYNNLYVINLLNVAGKDGILNKLKDNGYTITAYENQFFSEEETLTDDLRNSLNKYSGSKYNLFTLPGFTARGFDKNKDDLITKEEYTFYNKNEIKSFDSIDFNQNGYISVKEIMNFYFNPDGLDYRLKVAAKRYFGECDLLNSGKASYNCLERQSDRNFNQKLFPLVDSNSVDKIDFEQFEGTFLNFISKRIIQINSTIK